MKGNLILSSLLFLPYLQNSTTELLVNILDDFMELKDFSKTQNDILYKELNTEDEIIDAITNIIDLDKNAKKQLVFRIQLIFKNPKPIDIETTSDTNDWNLVFEYLDNTLLPNQNNAFFGLGLQCSDMQLYKNRFVYDENSWYGWRITYANKNRQNNSYDLLLPNAELTNSLILNIIQKYDVEKETKDMNDKEKLSFFENRFRAVIQTKNEGGMIELATKIAEDNGYVYQPELSNHNAKFKIEYTKNKRKYRILKQSTRRNIFKSTNTDKLVIYLSLDFENFQYEVCNESGKHQGVWNLSGRKTDAADEDHHIITDLSMK